MNITNHSRLLWKNFLLNRWPIYLWGAFSVLMTNFMQVLAPKNIGWIVDFFNHKPIPKFFVESDQKQTFLNLFFVLVLSRIIINIFRFFWRITLGRQTHYACAMLRRDVWDHVRFFKKSDLDSKYTKGSLMNAEASDTNSARFIFGFTLVAITDVAFLGFFTFATMLLINSSMAILSFFVLLFIPFMVRKLSSKEVEQYRIIQDTLSSFNDLSSQAVSTLKLQRLTQTGSFWEKRLMNIAENHRMQKLKGINLSLMYIPVMGIATIVSYVILFVFGIIFTFNGKMSVGDFISMQGLIFLLHDPLMSLGFIVSEWKKGFAALDRLTDIFTNPKDPNLISDIGHTIPISCEHVLSVNNLAFSFDNQDIPLFENISFSLSKGDRLGICGAIGSGKSTLISLLCGLERKVLRGKIKFCDQDFSFFSHEFLRNQIGIVPQKPFLFADSIKENVSMGQLLSDEDIWFFLELAGLRDDVELFPDKLETQLGEWGINLSGGQKQRLTLARALAKKPNLLFLDDCLSAVDTLTEEKILKNLDQFLNDVTLVWVAHRKSTLKYCHRVLELNNFSESPIA